VQSPRQLPGYVLKFIAQVLKRYVIVALLVVIQRERKRRRRE
jgi:hypothetical protein